MTLTLSPSKPSKKKGDADGTIEQIEKAGGVAGSGAVPATHAICVPNQWLPLGLGTAVAWVHAPAQVACTHPLAASAPTHPLPPLQLVHVRLPGSLEMRPRSVRQLSGEDSTAGVLHSVLLGCSISAPQRQRCSLQALPCKPYHPA